MIYVIELEAYVLTMDQPQRKSIIFVGRTGSGKSSLATMLYKGHIPHNNPLHVSDSAKGATLECRHVKSLQYDIYDTVGLGEPEGGSVPCEDARKKLREFIKSLKRDFNYICIVKKSGRLDTLDPVVFDVTKELFKGAETNIVLVITDDEDGEWAIEENVNLMNVYGKIPIFSVNIPKVSKKHNLEKIYIEQRKESIDKFEEDLIKRCNYKPARPKICGYTDKEIDELIDRIMKIVAAALKITYYTLAGALVICSLATVGCTIS